MFFLLDWLGRFLFGKETYEEISKPPAKRKK